MVHDVKRRTQTTNELQNDIYKIKVKPVSNEMSHEICDNTKSLAKSTAVALIRGHFHVTFELRMPIIILTY